MKTQTNKKLSAALWSLVYFALTCAIVVSCCFIFKANYYTTIYVSGRSMNPTLSGTTDDHDYGIIDKNENAIKHLKRYQIITTHYQLSQEDDLKIKRVIALPGESFKMQDNELYLLDKAKGVWNKLPTTYERNLDIIPRNIPETTLKDDEYYVLGDNYQASTDSFSVGPIKREMLEGVLIEMQGRCKVRDGKIVEKHPYQTRYFFGEDF